METKKIAEKIWKEVKATLSDARKRNKEKKDYWRVSQMANIAYDDNSTWTKERGWVTNGYIIKVEEKEIARVSSKYDLKMISNELSTLISGNKKVKGWGGLVAVTERVSFGLYDDFNFITKICLADAPCKEFKSLQNYINKYGVNNYGGNVCLNNYELFSASMGGKRGRLWDEYGEREFIDNKPKKCQRILDELRGHRGSKDTMKCVRGNEDYIDEIDRRYSEYHEVECEGERRYYMLIEIKTPSGKVKYTTKIY